MTRCVYHRRYPEDGVNMILRNLFTFIPKYTWRPTTRRHDSPTSLTTSWKSYRIFSNPIRTSFCRFFKRKKKLVRGSNPHLSFNRPLRAAPSEVARWVSAAWKAIRHLSLCSARLIQSTPPQLCFFHIHFNIILPPMLSHSKWSLFFGFPHKNTVCVSVLSHTCHVPGPSHPVFGHPNSN